MLPPPRAPRGALSIPDHPSTHALIDAIAAHADLQEIMKIADAVADTLPSCLLPELVTELQSLLLDPQTCEIALIAFTRILDSSPELAWPVLNSPVLEHAVSSLHNCPIISARWLDVFAAAFASGGDDAQSAILAAVSVRGLLDFHERVVLSEMPENERMEVVRACCRLLELFPIERACIDGTMRVCDHLMHFIPSQFALGARQSYELAFPHVLGILERLVACEALTPEQFAIAAKFVAFLITRSDPDSQIASCRFWERAISRGYDSGLLDCSSLVSMLTLYDGEVREAAYRLVLALAPTWERLVAGDFSVLNAMLNAPADDFGSMRLRAISIISIFRRADPRLFTTFEAAACAIDFLRIDDDEIVSGALDIISTILPALSDPLLVEHCRASLRELATSRPSFAPKVADILV